MDQSILNSIFLKKLAIGITTVATGIDDVIMPVVTILL
jgi:hypothetical protein